MAVALQLNGDSEVFFLLAHEKILFKIIWHAVTQAFLLGGERSVYNFIEFANQIQLL